MAGRLRRTTPGGNPACRVVGLPFERQTRWSVPVALSDSGRLLANGAPSEPEGMVPGYLIAERGRVAWVDLASQPSMRVVGCLPDHSFVGEIRDNDGHSVGAILRDGDFTRLSAEDRATFVPCSVSGAGRLAGYVHSHGDNLSPAVWYKGVVHRVGIPGDAVAVLTAVNDSGMLAGDFYTSDGELHAFCWFQGAMADIGTMGGEFSCAKSVNSSGVVVGYSTTGSGVVRAFAWDRASGMTDLASLAGENSVACSINDHGDIVGDSIVPGAVGRGVLWRRGRIYDLNDITEGLEGAFVNGATCINGDGIIAAMMWGPNVGSDRRQVVLINSRSGSRLPADHAGHRCFHDRAKCSTRE